MRKLVLRLAPISTFGAFHLLMFAETACGNETSRQQVGLFSYAHLILHLLETSGDFLPFAHF